MYRVREFSAFYILPGDFTSNDVPSGSLLGHITSFPVMSLPPTTSYSLVGSEMCRICKFSACYSHFPVTSGKMTSLLGHFQSPEVTWCHLLPLTASYCELQPCRKWNVQHTPVFGLLQPLSGDFGWNEWLPGNFRSDEATWHHCLSRDCILKDVQPCKWNVQIRHFETYSHFEVTFGQMTSLPITECHMTSFPATWLPPCVSYSLVGSKTCSTHALRPSTATSRWLLIKWRHFWVTSVHLRSREFISCHVIASYCKLQACRKWNVHNTPVFGLL